MGIITREYRTITAISGPLVFAERITGAGLGEVCAIRLPDGEVRTGQILQLSGDHAVIQVLEGTSGIDAESRVVPTGRAARIGVSMDMFGRVFNGFGNPLDGLPPIIPEKYMDLYGLPLNPASREKPDFFIQTGISVIDGLNTFVRGQKLPIFSCAGLPANELAMQIVRQAKVSGGEGDRFCVLFGAMGITSREAFFFKKALSETPAMERTISFINEASDPTIERLFTPRIALTAAEYLAFEKGYHVMVVLTDMTAYCEALREVGSAREEIPGRRSYPGYMYTDLASIYERSGRIRGLEGSITLMPILTMPDDDITHPIPDLSGYITEGQIVLSRSLHRKGVYPPIDALPCLSRLMNLGIGKGKTRDGHRRLADRLYSAYAKGVDVRRLVTIVGEEGLTELDRSYLKFSDEFEMRFVGQGDIERSVDETLDLGIEILKTLPSGGGTS